MRSGKESRVGTRPLRCCPQERSKPLLCKRSFIRSIYDQTQRYDCDTTLGWDRITPSSPPKQYVNTWRDALGQRNDGRRLPKRQTPVSLKRIPFFEMKPYIRKWRVNYDATHAVFPTNFHTILIQTHNFDREDWKLSETCETDHF